MTMSTRQDTAKILEANSTKLKEAFNRLEDAIDFALKKSKAQSTSTDQIDTLTKENHELKERIASMTQELTELRGTYEHLKSKGNAAVETLNFSIEQIKQTVENHG